MGEWKKRWKKNKVPWELKDNPDLWRSLIQYWMTPAAQIVSTTNSANRKSDQNGKGQTTYNLGATSKESRTLELLDGKPFSLLRSLIDAHTNKKTGVINDLVAQEISEAVMMCCDKFIQSQESVDGPPCTKVPVEKINEFLTQKSRGHFDRIPLEGSASLDCSFSYYCDLSIMAELDVINKAFEALQAEVAAMKEKQEEQARQLEEDRKM